MTESRLAKPEINASTLTDTVRERERELELELENFILQGL